MYIFVLIKIFLFAHPMTRYDPSRAGRSGNKSEQSSNPKASEGLYKIILSTHYLVVGGPPFTYLTLLLCLIFPCQTVKSPLLLYLAFPAHLGL